MKFLIRSVVMKVLLISNYNIVEGRGPMFRLMNMIPYLNKKCNVELCSLGKMDDLVIKMALKNQIRYYEIAYKTKGWFVKNAKEIADNIIDIANKDNIDLIVLTWEIWDVAVALQKDINNCHAKLAIVMHSIPFVAASINTGNYVMDYIKKILFEPRFMIKQYLICRIPQVNYYMHKFNILTMTKTVEYKLNKYFKKIHLYTTYPGYAVDLPLIPKKINYKYDFVYMAKFEYGKGIYEIVKIMEEIKKTKPNFKLALVGDFTFKDEESKFFDKIKKCNLDDNIDCLGWLDGEQKYETIIRSKIFLYPSFAGDTFSICLLEALSCGKQVVCYDVPFVKDNFNIRTVHKIPVFKNKLFAKKAIELLDEKKYNVKESIDFVKYNYSSWNEVANAEYNAYKKVLKNKNE